MAAPTLQAQGAINAVTTGDCVVTLPAHQADDILVVSAILWAPNGAKVTGATSDPAGWALMGGATLFDGTFALIANLDVWWRRATSGAESDPTLVRPAGSDSGADTCFAGRAYVIRGCETSGNPWDDTRTSSTHSTANQAFSFVTVSGTERMVVQFYSSTDNNTIGAAPALWTAGTSAVSGTGTDAGFQTYRRDNVSSSTSAASPTITAPAQGSYYYVGASFKPPAPVVGGDRWKTRGARSHSNFNNSSYY